MKIKKMYQGSVPENKILNTYSDSQTDVYSCEYVNNIGGSGGDVDLSNYYNKTETEVLVDNKIAKIPISDLLHYKGHVNTVDDLPSGSPIGSYQLPLGVHYNLLITPSTSSYAIRNSIATYKKFFIVLENNYNDSGTNGFMGLGIATDYPEQVTIHFEGRTFSSSYESYTPVLHIEYDENKPVYYAYQSRTTAGPYYKLDSATDNVRLSDNYATSGYTLITESMLLGLGITTAQVNHANSTSYCRVRIETNFTKLYMDTSYGNLFGYKKYETIISPSSYYWNSGMVFLTCPTNVYNDVTYQLNASNAEVNDIYTVGDNKDIYRCSENSSWELWSGSEEVDLSNFYTKEETDATLTNYYDKNEVDNLIENIPNSGESVTVNNAYNTSTNETYSCSYINNLSAGEGVDLSNYYTKTETENLINNKTFEDTYSNAEQRVGTWIDGKPFYRKVVSVSNLTVKSGTTYTHGIANVKEILPMTCGRMLYGNNTPYYTYPLVANSGAMLGATFDTTYIKWVGNDSWGTSHTHMFVIYYTKTTD